MAGPRKFPPATSAGGSRESRHERHCDLTCHRLQFHASPSRKWRGEGRKSGGTCRDEFGSVTPRFLVTILMSSLLLDRQL